MKLENTTKNEQTINFEAKKAKISTEIRPPDIVYDNTQQGIIRISEDRLELRARDFKKAVEQSVDWKAPLGIFATFFVCIATAANFTSFLGFTAEEVRILIYAGFFASGIWLIRSAFSIYLSRNKIKTARDFVESCKNNH